MRLNREAKHLAKLDPSYCFGEEWDTATLYKCPSPQPNVVGWEPLAPVTFTGAVLPDGEWGREGLRHRNFVRLRDLAEATYGKGPRPRLLRSSRHAAVYVRHGARSVLEHSSQLLNMADVAALRALRRHSSRDDARRGTSRVVVRVERRRRLEGRRGHMGALWRGAQVCHHRLLRGRSHGVNQRPNALVGGHRAVAPTRIRGGARRAPVRAGVAHLWRTTSCVV